MKTYREFGSWNWVDLIGSWWRRYQALEWLLRRKHRLRPQRWQKSGLLKAQIRRASEAPSLCRFALPPTKLRSSEKKQCLCCSDIYNTVVGKVSIFLFRFHLHFLIRKNSIFTLFLYFSIFTLAIIESENVLDRNFN